MKAGTADSGCNVWKAVAPASPGFSKGEETMSSQTTTEEKAEESLADPFAAYPFSAGDQVVVDWTDGRQISGIVEEIEDFRALKREDVVISVTDYDDPDWKPHGCTYDCAPDWITVED